MTNVKLNSTDTVDVCNMQISADFMFCEKLLSNLCSF